MSKADKLLSDFLDEPIEQPASVLVSERPKPQWQKGPKVNNVPPTIRGQPYRIAIIGEAPGSDEEKQGIPFVGMSGRFLSALLSKANILRDACFIGNICQYRPPNNDISFFSRDGDEIKEGLEELTKALSGYNPNICLLLGKTALWAAKDVDSIGDWRGSFFISDKQGPFYGRKCIASYHPAACLRQYDWTPLLMMDVKRCVSEATFPELVLPQRDLRIDLNANQIVEELEKIEREGLSFAADIEGGIKSMSCISLATSANYSFLIPFAKMSGANYWSEFEDELKIWKALIRVLANPNIKKTFQSGLYDRFVLQYGYGIMVHGNEDDTLLKFWEQYCELDKNLGFQNSILTKEPYYKSDIDASDIETFFRYCCRDSATTKEISERLNNILSPRSKQHYQFNISLLNPLLYAEVRGIRYDTALAKTRLAETNDHVYSYQSKLDIVAGYGLDQTKPREALVAEIQGVMCFKRNCDQPKKAFEEVYPKVLKTLKQTELSDKDWGFLNISAKRHLNLRSPDFKDYLYERLKFPTQYKKDIKTKLMRPTSDYEALLKLSKSHDHPALKIALELGRLRTRAQMLSIKCGSDGRMHCSYNLVGSETGRITSSKSVIGGRKSKDRVGTNMQTVSDDWDMDDDEHPLAIGLRNLYQADPGYYLFQCDLKGADGWTIAPHLKRLGDSTMLDDFYFGLKPAQILCYTLRHGYDKLARKSREEIAELVREVKKTDWDYFACKIGIWGTFYLMGPKKLAEQVFKESDGKFNITEKEAKDLQSAVFLRYNGKRWHKWMETIIRSSGGKAPRLTAASGHTRIFYGRPSELLGEMLAHEPQDNTTYATNLAAYKLWTDPENRISTETSAIGNGLIQARHELRAEPLHQVHDALIGQFKIEDTAWAVGKIRQWFNNKLIIANQEIIIPFEGSYGTNWAMDDKSKVGNI